MPAGVLRERRAAKRKVKGVGLQMEQELLTVEEVARRLSMSRQGVWSLIRSGALPAVRISPRRLRVHPGDLEKWVERRTSWKPQQSRRGAAWTSIGSSKLTARTSAH